MSLSPQAGIPAGSDGRVGVVELDAEGAADSPTGQRLVEAPVLDPQVVEQPQRLAGEVPELRVVRAWPPAR